MESIKLNIYIHFQVEIQNGMWVSSQLNKAYNL